MCNEGSIGYKIHNSIRCPPHHHHNNSGLSRTSGFAAGKKKPTTGCRCRRKFARAKNYGKTRSVVVYRKLPPTETTLSFPSFVVEGKSFYRLYTDTFLEGGGRPECFSSCFLPPSPFFILQDKINYFHPPQVTLGESEDTFSLPPSSLPFPTNFPRQRRRAIIILF